MTAREWAKVVAVVAGGVLLGTLGYLLDRWILTSSLPDWVKLMLLHHSG